MSTSRTASCAPITRFGSSGCHSWCCATASAANLHVRPRNQNRRRDLTHSSFSKTPPLGCYFEERWLPWSAQTEAIHGYSQEL